MYIEVIKVLPNVDFYSKFSWDFNQRYLVEETKLVSHPTVFPKVLFLFFFTWTEIPNIIIISPLVPSVLAEK